MTLISATQLAETSSYWAQGGLAAALAAEDSAELHLEDTLRGRARSGARSRRRACWCEEAPEAVEDLTRLGVTFDADRSGRLALGLEGGHSLRRDRARRRRGDGSPDRPPALGGRRDGTSGSTCSRGAAYRRCSPTMDALHRSPARRRRAIAGPQPSCSAPAARPRCGRARPTPPAPSGTGLLLAHAAGRCARRHRVHAVPPHGGRRGRRSGGDGLLVTEAIRGEGARAAQPRRRAVRRRARSARRGGASDLSRAAASTGVAMQSHSTCAPSTRRCSRMS